MTTLKITLPTSKAGQLAIYTIEFAISNFDLVIEQVSNIKTIEELKKSNLFKII